MIPDMLKMYRKKKGLKQADIAKVLRISQAHYSRIETGEQTPSLDQLEKLAKIFGVSVENLTESEKESPEKRVVPLMSELSYLRRLKEDAESKLNLEDLQKSPQLLEHVLFMIEAWQMPEMRSPVKAHIASLSRLFHTYKMVEKIKKR